jgi:probable blue pigment (indigoidine) exporter
MARNQDVFLTALAPIVWGSTYLVTTEILPQGHALTLAMLRALPSGLLLLALTRILPRGIWWCRVFVLGALNFSFFWWMLFVAAYRLPGGVAATVGAVQPLIVLFLAHGLLRTRLRLSSVLVALCGVGGVALLMLTPKAPLDPLGLLAALAGTISMAFGTVLTRRWEPPVSAVTFTAWQLVAGGMLLLPAVFIAEPPLNGLSALNIGGLAYLSIVGGALTYLLWFRGIACLGALAVAPLGLLSPFVAVLLGWFVLNQRLGPTQIIGLIVVFASVWGGQRLQRPFLSTPR